MTRIHEQSLISLEVEISWQSPEARHTERYLARRVNLWRDILPPQMHRALLGKVKGDVIRLEYPRGQALPGFNPKLVHHLRPSRFTPRNINGRKVAPLKGRFYPRGMFGSLPGVFPQNIQPGRITDLDDRTMTVDLNHPLAGYDLTLQAKILDVADKITETGGRLTCWMEEWTDNGPGMQARYKGRPTSFNTSEDHGRLDESNDAEFYKQPRMIGHVDAQASAFLEETYARILSPRAKILDLMSSIQSHLPEHLQLHVTGLGMNAVEMQANPRLAAHVVHDLNKNPVLPFAEGSFEAVVCSLSIEYLVNPAAVLAHCRRVLRPGGHLLVGFSNRWFPSKATEQWMDLHEFERIGFVLDLFLSRQGFAALETVSIRNWRRPEDDAHIVATSTSDPVYVVMGTRH